MKLKPVVLPIPVRAAQRLIVRRSHLDGITGCWVWTKGLDVGGYGRLKRARVELKAHRVAYAVFVGPIPPGLIILHRCDNPPCVNPEHLRLGTHLDNQQDMTHKGRGRSGVRNGRTRLTDEAVQALREEVARTGVTFYRLGKRLGMSSGSLYNAITGRTWRHVA